MDDRLGRLERLYWQNVRLQVLDWNDAGRMPLTELLREPETQDALLQRLGVLHLDIAVVEPHRQPVRASRAYTIRFLKELMRLLEDDHTVEVSETLYETLALYIAAQSADEKTCHRCYYLPPTPAAAARISAASDRVVLCEEIPAISQGTTGLRTWQAGLRLIELFASNPSAVAGKRVLELGSGVGLLGLMCAKLGAAQVYLTDGDAPVLPRLASNILLNDAGAAVSAFKLDWEWTSAEMDAALADAHADYDVVVGSDCVWSPDLTLPLARTIAHALRSSRNPARAVCYMASTVRREATFALFQDNLAACRLATTPYAEPARASGPSPALWFHYEEDAERVEVLCIKLAE
ncbi:putative methyltransferase-domain-containing protein [Entophlyctis helioformis]|nr:putative methyltransferase-domain-containing protein [Entophlyctis helioformis]